MKIKIIINCLALAVLLSSLPKNQDHCFHHLSPDSLFSPVERKLYSQKETLKRLNQKLIRGEPITLLFVCGFNKERSFLWHILGEVIVKEKGLSDQIKISSAGVFVPVFDIEAFPEEQREALRMQQKILGQPNSMVEKSCLEQLPATYHDLIKSFSSSPISAKRVRKADAIIVAADVVAEEIAEKSGEGLTLAEFKDKLVFFSLLSEDLAKKYQQNMPDYSTWVYNYMKRNQLKQGDLDEAIYEKLAIEYFEVTGKVLREKFFAAILSPLEEAHSQQKIKSIQTAI